MTPAHAVGSQEACEKGDLNLVQRWMLDSGAQPNANCLITIACLGYTSIAQFLVQHAEVKFDLTKLCLACPRGHLELVRYFVEDL